MQTMQMTGLTTPGPIEVNAYARQLDEEWEHA